MDAIPSPIQTVLDLFATDLADVRFADVDAQTLTRVAADVQAAAELVASAQTALDTANESLQERQDALLQHAQRAVAYARVYAENDAALCDRLTAIALPRPVRKTRANGDALILSSDPETPARPRGRPRKAVPAEPIAQTLPLTGKSAGE